MSTYQVIAGIFGVTATLSLIFFMYYFTKAREVGRIFGFKSDKANILEFRIFIIIVYISLATLLYYGFVGIMPPFYNGDDFHAAAFPLAIFGSGVLIFNYFNIIRTRKDKEDYRVISVGLAKVIKDSINESLSYHQRHADPSLISMEIIQKHLKVQLDSSKLAMQDKGLVMNQLTEEYSAQSLPYEIFDSLYKDIEFYTQDI